MSEPLMLNELQAALETIYGVTSPHRVEDFVISRPAIEQLGGRVQAPEQLFVYDDGESVDIGLYLHPSVMASLPDLGPGRLLGGMLPSFTTALEGVSHFVYVTLRALMERTVSMLELEVQAEVDKFATSVLHLWKHGEKRRAGELRQDLFDRVHFRSDLDGEERHRYQTANRLARGYAAWLEEKFVRPGALEALLRELRQVYRLASAEKLAYLAARA